jgi:hypothetical protein
MEVEQALKRGKKRSDGIVQRRAGIRLSPARIIVADQFSAYRALSELASWRAGALRMSPFFTKN